ncbi:hypothetical protein Aduo_005994 [Ancylostoma duodenale]
MRSATSTSQQKANFLICYLDGVAREKIEELSEQERADYTSIVAHLRKFFEGPQHRYMYGKAILVSLPAATLRIISSICQSPAESSTCSHNWTGPNEPEGARAGRIRGKTSSGHSVLCQAGQSGHV